MVDSEQPRHHGLGGEPSFDRLLGAVRGGDLAARDEIYRRVLPALRRWASRRLPAHARSLIDTDDLTQEALMRTLDRLGTLDVDSHGLVAYLRTAVLNRIRDEVRRASRRPVDGSSLETAVDEGPSPLDLAIGAQASERYERALQQISARERSAVILRIELGFGFQEIADALDWNSANTARMAVSRAIERLATSMSGGSE